MKTERLSLKTGNSRALVDLTDEVRRFVQNGGDGLVNVFVPHATAGLALMEMGSGSEQDLWALLDELLPRDNRYVHSHGSRGHGADHILPALLPPTLTLPVMDGKVALGVWQSIVLVDPNVDNSERQVVLAFLADRG
jgi:secondary thiamine-phosphate synthase enzyme